MRNLDNARAAIGRAEQALPDPERAIQAIDDAIVELFQVKGMLVFDADQRDWYSPREPSEPARPPRGWTPGDPYGIFPEQRAS